MHTLPPLIYDLALMLGLASIVIVIFQRIRQPIVLGYLIAGAITGPHMPPHIFISDVDTIKSLSDLGVIFLMFSLGLEFNFKKLKRVGVSASFMGLMEVLLMIFIGYGLGLMLGWNHYDSLFLGAALSISSTTIIIKAIEELKLKTKHFAQLVVGVLVIEDLLAILLLVALSTIVVTNHVLSYDMFSAAIKLITIIGSWFLLGYFLVPPLCRRISAYVSDETITIIAVAMCLFLVVAAEHVGYSAALGAFIMGSILAETVLIDRIEHVIRPIRDIFAAVFFISVGMLIDPYVIVHEWRIVLLITVITMFGKIISTTMSAIVTGQSIHDSVRAGFSMAQIGEFSFIIIAMGLSLQVINQKLYPLIVAVSCLTTFTTPYLIRISNSASQKLAEALSRRLLDKISIYNEWMASWQGTAKENAKYTSVMIRLMMNSIIIAIIFTVLDQVIFQHIDYFQSETWDANAISFMIAIILSSPFIWGMLVSYRKLKMTKEKQLMIHPSVWLIWTITFAEIAFLGVVYFDSWLTIIFIIVAGSIFFTVMYKKLEQSYRWFEKNLIKNINAKKK